MSARTKINKSTTRDGAQRRVLAAPTVQTNGNITKSCAVSTNIPKVNYLNYNFKPLEAYADVIYDRYCGPTPESNWVLPGILLVGAYPACNDDNETFDLISSILLLGITKFVCLQKEYREAGVTEMMWRSGKCIRPYFLDVRLIIENKHNIELFKQPYLDHQPSSPKSPGGVVTGNNLRHSFIPVQRNSKANVINNSHNHFKRVVSKEGLGFIHFPIEDCNITDDNGVLQCARQLVYDISCGEVIYLHCWGGHGRTGTVVCLMLHLMYGLSAVEAMKRCQFVHDLRQYPVQVGSPQTETQRAQVTRIIAQLEIEHREQLEQIKAAEKLAEKEKNLDDSDSLEETADLTHCSDNSDVSVSASGATMAGEKVQIQRLSSIPASEADTDLIEVSTERSDSATGFQTADEDVGIDREEDSVTNASSVQVSHSVCEMTNPAKQIGDNAAISEAVNTTDESGASMEISQTELVKSEPIATPVPSVNPSTPVKAPVATPPPAQSSATSTNLAGRVRARGISDVANIIANENGYDGEDGEKENLVRDASATPSKSKESKIPVRVAGNGTGQAGLSAQVVTSAAGYSPAAPSSATPSSHTAENSDNNPLKGGLHRFRMQWRTTPASNVGSGSEAAGISAGASTPAQQPASVACTVPTTPTSVTTTSKILASQIGSTGGLSKIFNNYMGLGDQNQIQNQAAETPVGSSVQGAIASSTPHQAAVGNPFAVPSTVTGAPGAAVSPSTSSSSPVIPPKSKIPRNNSTIKQNEGSNNAGFRGTFF